jgi:hypothetical protein
MQRRIKAQPQETAGYQALIDHKQATLNVILSQIPAISTFAQLICVQISCLSTFRTLKTLGIAQL